MKQYQITIKLKNGDEVNAKVAARNQSDAIKRLQGIPEVADLLNGQEIEKIDVEPIQIKPIDNERFGVTTIDNKPGWYVIADLDNGIKVEWKKGMYNETNRPLPIGENGMPVDTLKLATALREIGEYLSLNFKELI